MGRMNGEKERRRRRDAYLEWGVKGMEGVGERERKGCEGERRATNRWCDLRLGRVPYTGYTRGGATAAVSGGGGTKGYPQTSPQKADPFRQGHRKTC